MNKCLALAIAGAFALAANCGYAQTAAPAATPAAKPAAAPAAAPAPAAATPAAAPAAAPAAKPADKPAASDKAAASKTAATDKPLTPQQQKMKDCQASAGEKKLEGKDRQDFVNKCLKAAPAKQESKMAMCNKKTAGLKADERSKAQSECMKAS